MQVQLIKITAASAFVARCVDTNTILQFSVGTQGSLNRERLREGQTLSLMPSSCPARTWCTEASLMSTSIKGSGCASSNHRRTMPLYRVRVSTDNNVALTRHLEAPSIMHMLPGLSALCHETACRFSSGVSSVCVDPSTHTQATRAFRFTNICGKIVHYAHPEFYQPGVRALVTEAKNEFGCSDSLYSADCNLITTRSRTNTLFRGGNNTARIMQCIEHAFAPEAIKDATVHMLVGNVRLAHPINVCLCGISLSFVSPGPVLMRGSPACS